VLTRRDLLGRGGVTGLAVIGGCAGDTKKFETKPVTAQDGIVEIKISDYEDLVTPGGMVALQPTGSRRPVLVMRLENDAFRVLSLRCTHLGCTVRWDDASQVLRCPCHGSRFDDRGHVVEGPAKQSLAEYPSEAMGTTLKFKITDD